MIGRYESKDKATLTDRVIFDNTTGFLNSIPKVLLVGEIIGFGSEDNLIVEFDLAQGMVRENIPYFLLK